MRGSIRVAIGFMVVFGAVGTLDIDPHASVLVQSGLAALGLFVMYSGARAMNPKEWK